MTQQQYDELTRHKGIYDLYLQTQTVNGAHPSVAAINDIHNEVLGFRFRTGCGACVIDGLTTIYNLYNIHTKNNTTNGND